MIGSSSATAMAGPMPGSTPTKVPSRTPIGGEGEVLRREGVGEAVEEQVQGVHQRIPSRIPGGSGTSRPT